mmetsp:Transcript_9768/g.16450  ORF Transcript_9768/g.16450 Transcript_9768/m.16450 type:complete len:258 (-) Transcript_9768:908-1681(-)
MGLCILLQRLHLLELVLPLPLRALRQRPHGLRQAPDLVRHGRARRPLRAAARRLPEAEFARPARVLPQAVRGRERDHRLLPQGREAGHQRGQVRLDGRQPPPLHRPKETGQGYAAGGRLPRPSEPQREGAQQADRGALHLHERDQEGAGDSARLRHPEGSEDQERSQGQVGGNDLLPPEPQVLGRRLLQAHQAATPLALPHLPGWRQPQKEPEDHRRPREVREVRVDQPQATRVSSERTGLQGYGAGQEHPGHRDCG